MSITYVDPTGETSSAVQPYALSLDVSKRPLRLALVANSFPDVRNFVDCIERALAPLLPGATLTVWQKPSVEPVSPKMLDDIVAQSDGVIAALGH